MITFFITVALDFFVAFGVVLGGSILGGISAFLTHQPPMDTMADLAEKLKIWALVAAIGGTFDPIYELEKGFMSGEMSPVIKQVLYILSAFYGAHVGTQVIKWIVKGEL
ncbi:YtrH family sporulation protein [Microaerobacter geothermalis]|uniref:YtrH family sporulation protein n=1 Tax=Microaerobacter geothermalis TaxID=674972 RepID=UPI001F1747C9|nr:YtrH family sporulation protein [Microaerobacter geothermalis]MCF6094627.1 YtrH family sporulation protein [Microaerobacter geothermalis]